jgi:sister-chromatid-cohesion protein PDS5
MNKQLVRNLVSILVEVLQEADTVPAGVMECILNQFETFANVSSHFAGKLTAETGHTIVSDGC